MSISMKYISLSILTALSIHTPTAFGQKTETVSFLPEEYYEQDSEDSLADFYGDEEFVSIATGNKKRISKAPAVTSVITAKDIESMGARTLSQVLETVPGLHVSHSSQTMAPKFKIRGISTLFNPQTLVLVDGTPISSVVRGDRHVVWGEYPVKAIARVEVIRGPGSALYGADAFAGVINIITKGYDDIQQTDIGVGAGSHNSKQAWLNTKHQLNNLKLAFNAQFNQTDGQDSIIAWDAQSNLDALELAPPASLAPGTVQTGYTAYDFNLSMEYNEFSFKAFYQGRDDVGAGQGIAEAIDTHGKFSSDKLMLDASYLYDINEMLSSNLSLSHYRSSQEIESNVWLFPPGAIFGAFPEGMIGNPEWWEQTTIAKAHFSYEQNTNYKLDFGLGYKLEDLYKVKESKNFDANFQPLGELVDVSDTDEVFMPESDRDSYFVYVQGEFHLAPDWELTAGVRYDDYSDFGSTTNPRLALVWSSTHKLTTKLLYGQAFRAPAFAETTTVNNPVALGNPNLKPETIETLEVAFNYKMLEDLSWDLNIYKYKIDDLIDFVPDEEQPTNTAQNKGEVNGYGAELELNYHITNELNLLANYSYQKATYETADHDLGEAPNNLAYLRLNWQATEKLSVNTQVNYVGSQSRTAIDNRANVPSYVNTSLSIQYRNIFPGWHVRLLSTNLFDEEITEPSTAPTPGNPVVAIPNDLPQAGRSVYFDISKTF